MKNKGLHTQESERGNQKNSVFKIRQKEELIDEGSQKLKDECMALDKRNKELEEENKRLKVELKNDYIQIDSLQKIVEEIKRKNKELERLLEQQNKEEVEENLGDCGPGQQGIFILNVSFILT